MTTQQQIIKGDINKGLKFYHLKNYARKIAKENKADIDTEQEIDWEQEFDWSLTYWELKTILEDKLRKLGLQIKQSISEDEERAFRKDVLEREERHEKKRIKEKIEKLSKEEEINIEQFSFPKLLVKAIAEGVWNSLIFEGEEGVGKTHLVLSCLKGEYGEDFSYIKRYSTPLEFYHTLYRNNNKKIIVFDDVEKLLENDITKNLLKSVLDPDIRKVSYYSTSMRLNAPKEFLFKPRVIIIANKLPDDPVFNAVKDRCLYYDFRFSYNEKIEIMKELIKKDYKNLSLSERKEVLNYLIEITNPSTERFSLRTLFKALSLKKGFDIWKEIVKELLNMDEELLFIYEMEKKGVKVSKQVRRFKEEFGYSRATYFRRKKDLKERIGGEL